MSTLQQKLMCVGCDTKLKKSVGRKKLVSDELVSDASSRCLKRRIYRNNSDATFDDLTFEVKVKLKKAISEAEYSKIRIQRTVATHKYCCICFSMKNSTVIPQDIFIPPGNRGSTTHSKKSNI